jgi:hypothetical protein
MFCSKHEEKEKIKQVIWVEEELKCIQQYMMMILLLMKSSKHWRIVADNYILHTFFIVMKSSARV